MWEWLARIIEGLIKGLGSAFRQKRKDFEERRGVYLELEKELYEDYSKTDEAAEDIEHKIYGSIDDLRKSL